MRRPGTPLTHEVLVEEARFILKTLQRQDLFGERVRLTEAERVLDSSISLAFADYSSFLHKFGYVRVDPSANAVEVTEGGARVAEVLDDAEFNARLSRHFARELSGAPTPAPPAPSRPLPRSEALQSVIEPVAARAQARTVVAPGPAERALDDVLDRRYRRGEMIGQGAVGTVYRGQHVSLGREMAIKEVRSVFQFASYLRRDEIVRRLRTTVETHARLVHPAIIQIVDQNSEREYPYFVMELARGGNLRQRMVACEGGRLELPTAVRVLTQIAYALDFAHAQGILHIGLKPENVLFDHLGNVKLSDFGFARITDRAEPGSQTPVLVGGNTVGYMAPERLQPVGGDAADLTPAVDIYALGLLFYEMITGKLPGRRSPLPSQARKDVPSAFDDVFDRMTRDEVGERYRSVDEVLDGLYKAFPSKEVFTKGTLLLWARDPKPLPEVEAEVAPEPEAVSEAPLPEPEPVEAEAEEVVDDALMPEEVVGSEEKTGEIRIPDEHLQGHRRRKTPPPPPAE
jgi:serine/threonine protein kinase